MDLIATNVELKSFEARLPAARGSERLSLTLELAWHLRQRDTRRALSLVGEVETMLTCTDLPRLEHRRVAVRLSLIRGEAKWLFADLATGEALAESALHDFAELDDPAGCADAQWLLSWIASDCGNNPLRVSRLEAALAAALRADDATRHAVIDATMAGLWVLRNRREAEERWGVRYQAGQLAAMHPAEGTYVGEFLGLSAFQASDFGRAAGIFMQAHQHALNSGQIRRAIIAAANVGYSFSRLNDNQTALEWKQLGVDLARPTGWPASIGACLMQTGETLRQLGRLDAAQEILQEALDTLSGLSGSRNYAITLSATGDLALDQGHHALALARFQELERRAIVLNQDDFQIDAWRGQADALSHLGCPVEALAAAQSALARARTHQDIFREISALKVMASIHAAHPLPPPPGMRAASAPLHFLQQALDAAAAIAGFTIPGDLLDAIAREHANAGDVGQAYRVSLQAIAARDRTHGQDATNRAVAMQVRHQTERAKAEGEHHRQLAAAEAKRAEVLQQTSDTLERLGAIGQEITGYLDSDVVFEALTRHVHGLLQIDSFCIYLMASDGLALNRVYGVEGSGRLPPGRIPLSSATADSARCMRERRELMIEKEPEADNPNTVPGTRPSLSLIFEPMMVGERALGVMTVQSFQAHAFGNREQLIFRTLCAYGAIAIDNANAYRQLKDAQQQLVAQEKLAALGSLVAGVAHELNTPIGNSMMVASALADKTRLITQKVQSQSIRRSDLVAYIEEAQEVSAIIMRGLTSAADLVASFKQVAVDRTTAQQRTFNLAQACHEVVATLTNRIKVSGHSITLDIPDNITFDSYPGPLGQVLSNLVINAMVHGFENRQGGQMTLSARPLGKDRVRIRFSDDGCGISPENLKRIFDPFFTTKMSQGGSGLGLSISFNIVTSLLGGQISAQSPSGSGALFTLELPLAAPHSDAAQSG